MNRRKKSEFVQRETFCRIASISRPSGIRVDVVYDVKSFERKTSVHDGYVAVGHKQFRKSARSYYFKVGNAHLLADSRNNRIDLTDYAEIQACLNVADGAFPYDRTGLDEFDSRKLGGGVSERFLRSLDSQSYTAAYEFVGFVDYVVSGRRPEIDENKGRAVFFGGGYAVDQPVRA